MPSTKAQELANIYADEIAKLQECQKNKDYKAGRIDGSVCGFVAGYRAGVLEAMIGTDSKGKVITKHGRR